jgi:uncharacterized protein YdhG (YjbR/CyaY superfamily)
MATKAAKTAVRTVTKKTTPKTVAGYIAAAPKEQRPALEKLRKTIKAAAPKATEAISYGIVGFKQGRKNVVYFGSWKEHIALYGTGGAGTIQFPADKPIPYGLVTRLVKARIAEIEKAG